jgi:hypothetical protein
MPFPETDSSAKKFFKSFLVASAFGSILFPFLLTVSAAFLLPWQGLLFVLVLELLLAIIPLREAPPPKFVQRFLHEATHAAIEWMSVRVVYKKADFLSPGPYVLGVCASVDSLSLTAWSTSYDSAMKDGTCAGLEPHSVLPVAIPAIMNTYAGVLPPATRNCHSLATSAAFFVPFGRHVWWWLNIRPATRKFVSRQAGSRSVCTWSQGMKLHS